MPGAQPWVSTKTLSASIESASTGSNPVPFQRPNRSMGVIRFPDAMFGT
jgi:hypothetical protein